MDHKISKDMISSGMIPSGEKSQADLGRTQYGSVPSPSSLMDAYKKIYEHHQKDADGKVIEHDDEELQEVKSPLAGVAAKAVSAIGKNLKKRATDNKGLSSLWYKGDSPKADTPSEPSPKTLSQDVDLFDIIKGRLLDEGADEEEALRIMANISQEDFDKLKEDITLTKGDYGSRNVKGSAYSTAKSKGFKGYKAGGGLGADFLPRV